ncbi:MAG TPA: ATP-binding protein, partial [Burkholderiaceae bacterium]|nr:ATP-binding protein [Burkholderiaceae bacterium]
AIYFAYQLEEMRLFQVVERIVELFQQGQLPLGQGSAGQRLEQMWRSHRPQPESVRRNAYWRMFGAAPGGDARAGEPNSEFVSLWMRFISAVSAYAPEHGAAALITPPTRANAVVRNAARDLAANLSASGWGAAHFVAEQLSADIQRALDILGDSEVQQAFGARDAWQVIDHVNTTYLGGARNVTRIRNKAQAGRSIFGWLAKLDQPSTQDDAELVDAVERWIAASVTSDDSMEEYAQPSESPQMSAPAGLLPAIAQDLLNAVGLAPGEPHASDGLIACFHGARRTGKTLAAYVLGQALSLDVLRLDLAAVSGPYIGETEKNISAAFDAAERAGQALLIDEADALFGRRTEVADAHDRYANIDVAYLLQRIEQFKGLVILESNLRDDIHAPFSSAAQHRWRAVRFPRRNAG